MKHNYEIRILPNEILIQYREVDDILNPLKFRPIQEWLLTHFSTLKDILYQVLEFEDGVFNHDMIEVITVNNTRYALKQYIRNHGNSWL